MTGSDTAGPRVGKTICERTSLLPRSCVLSGHLAAVGVSLLTCGSPATGKGSLTGERDRHEGQDRDVKVGVVRFGGYDPSVADARLTAQTRPRRRRSACMSRPLSA